MEIIGWAVMGLLAGGLARLVVREEKRGCLATIAVGLVGALIGGGLYRFATGDGFDFDGGFELDSLAVSLVGAVVFLLVLRAVGGRSTSRRQLR